MPDADARSCKEIHKAAVFQERQGWKASQIKDLKLVILENYRFMTSNSFFIALGIPDNYLKKITRIKSTLLPDTYKTSPDSSHL